VRRKLASEPGDLTMVALKRAYEKPTARDGVRVLVERLWPRGVKKETARIDLWLKDLAPSTELRKWYHARPSMWRRFRQQYLEELREPVASAALEQLYELVGARKTVTLVFASRDTEHNSAVVLKELLDGMRKPPSSSGPEKAAAAPMRARAKR
jgi:uncharacterized protein YeaO (DUF488 family)